MTKTTSSQRNLSEPLREPYAAAASLNAAIEEVDRAVFLLALRNLAEACGAMTALAEKTHLRRESLYRTLSNRGNSEIKSPSRHGAATAGRAGKSAVLGGLSG